MKKKIYSGSNDRLSSMLQAYYIIKVKNDWGLTYSYIPIDLIFAVSSS